MKTLRSTADTPSSLVDCTAQLHSMMPQQGISCLPLCTCLQEKLVLGGRRSPTCIVGVHVGPAEGDSRERIVKLADGAAVSRQLEVKFRANNALKQVRVAPVDLGQPDGQIPVMYVGMASGATVHDTRTGPTMEPDMLCTPSYKEGLHAVKRQMAETRGKLTHLS